MSDKREQAIKTLEDMINIAESLKNRDFIPKTIILDDEKVKSLKFALESIKVDRAYDLIHEKVAGITMQIVIDIDEMDYDDILNGETKASAINFRTFNAIRDGKPLPKGHGRLIDADYLKDVILLHNFHGNNKNIVPYADRRGYRLRQREVDEDIINAPTIIEADRKE